MNLSPNLFTLHQPKIQPAMPHDTPVLPGLSPVDSLDIHARFDGGALSSDGGVLLLREIERKLGISDVLASCLTDRRDAARTRHSHASMIRARVMAIACGYEDCDDMDALRHDPALKMACERAPDAALGLASQPTLSRLENSPSWRALARMGLKMVDLFRGSFSTVPRQITLDIDDTTDRTDGGQQLSLFNSHADGHFFQPIHIYEASTGKPVAFLLRPGKRPSGVEAARVLRHIIRRIRANWPRVAITLRGDGHYGAPQVMDLLEQLHCSYILGLPGNTRLKEIAHPWCEEAATRRALTGKDRVRRFFEASYAARNWSRGRRVIARIEATAMGADARFVVTNLTGRSKHLYQKCYCARGAMENLIKEHKLYTKSDRTSCHRWQANQFRLMLHTAAYWLLHSLRGAAPKRSRWRTASFDTIRRSFLKIAVRVEQLKTRIRLSLPSVCPHAPMISLMLGRIHAQGP